MKKAKHPFHPFKKRRIYLRTKDRQKNHPSKVDQPSTKIYPILHPTTLSQMSQTIALII
jgi:hypothetical protein